MQHKTIKQQTDEIIEILRLAKDAELVHEAHLIDEHIACLRKMVSLIYTDTQLINDMIDGIDECNEGFERILAMVDDWKRFNSMQKKQKGA